MTTGAVSASSYSSSWWRHSQAALADALGVSRQTVNAIETEKYDPSLPLAFKIARVFACAIEDIFVPDE
ncbi:helix-turn-helix transcriptional regulator [Luteitalea sp.]